ncbi:MAG TPA: response regulator [Phycisphaerae bacterium]|nr:response regulator [Phycisphaerae bacterium]HOJ75275.1 response regulator [Phycisphaerae bacterium]HOM53060.1 response regulator [Phycisphaerae bacterium]HOQ88250.1 response regulator [Phycisphaerae bacterium]HPP28223.1 response regulator [Phycisphaerae bacterium]
MYNRPVEILLVEPDGDLACMIRECLLGGLDAARVTVAADAAAAVREELTATHDVLVVATELPDAAWMDLVRELRRANRGPLILLAQEPTGAEMIEAIRAGVTDVLVKPFDLADLVERVDRAARRAFRSRRRRLRNRRLRKLTGRIIRERRDLRRRIDLICRDFVHAYRRLAQRVSDADLLSQR